MLTVIQRRPFYFVFLLFLILWTSISSDAERLFHQRDHSDLQSLSQHQAQPITDLHTAELFLSRYGFLKPVKWEEQLYEEPEEPDFSILEFNEFNIEEGSATPRLRDANHQNNKKLHDPQFITALRDFQKLSGLPVTGVFDEATKNAMNQPRCGVPDIEAEMEYSEEDTENFEEVENLDKNFENSASNASEIAAHSESNIDDSESESLEKVEHFDKNFETSSSNSSKDDLQNFNDKNSNSNEETHPKFMNNFDPVANPIDFHNITIETSNIENFGNFENSSGNYLENLNNINNTFQNFSNETDSKMTNFNPIANQTNFDKSTGKFAIETSDMENLYSNFESFSGNYSQNFNNINNTFHNFSNETNSKMVNNFDPIANQTSIDTVKMVTETTDFEMSNIDNLNTTGFYFGGSDFYDFENETVLNLTNFDPIGNTKITDILQNYNTEKLDIEIKEWPPNNQSKITNYQNLKITFGNMSNLNETNLNFTSIFYQISNISQDISSDAMVTEIEFGKPLIQISHLQNSKIENLNKSFDQIYNFSVDLFLNFNNTHSSHNNNLNSTSNFDPNLNDTVLIQSTENYSTVADLNLNNFSNEAVLIFNETNSKSSNKFDQFLNYTAVENIQNRTEYRDTEINFFNETILNFTTIFDLISNDTTSKIVRQNSTDIKATESKQNFVTGNLNFINFSNETNSMTNFDPIHNDTGVEKAIKTTNSTIDKNFKFRLYSNLDQTDNYTEIENLQQNSTDKRATETKNSTVVNLNFQNFLKEANRNSTVNFDPISNDATKEKLHLNSTEEEAPEINFFSETDLNSSTNLDEIDDETTIEIMQQNSTDKIKNETSKNSTFEIKNEHSNSTTSFDQIPNDTNTENMLQNSTGMSIKTTNSTMDVLNFRNYLNFANNFDPTDNYTTIENMHQNSTDKRALKIQNLTVNFDLISNDATKENQKKEATEINFFSKTDLNSSTNLVEIYNETTVEMIHQNSTDKIKNETIEMENVNSTTSFDEIFNDTNTKNMFQNRTELGIKTSNSTIDNLYFRNSTIENMQQNSDKIFEKNVTVHHPNFQNFLNETNQNSTIDFNPSANKTTNKTQHQNMDKTSSEITEIRENPAVTRRKRHLSSVLSERRRSRREAGGYMAFSKTVLRWRLIGEGYSSQLSVEEQRYVFRLAFRMWSEVCPLEFIEDTVSPLEEIDIRLGFGTGRHLGCQQRFDGSGREFAHAWFLGDIHFDDDEHFTGPNAGKGISLLKVAVHEIGHVLGLPHIYRPGSIMQPSYLPHESSFEVDWMDRKAIQNLYGGCRGRFNTVFDWIRRERTAFGEVVIRFNTYFMRQGWYWLYENRNNRTRYGDPVPLQSGWRGLPVSGVDGFLHVWSRRSDRVYFFKGSQFWRYDTDQDQVFRRDPEGVTYPRPISEGFPGVPSPIDTAVFDRTDGNIYFFKGALVYAFSVDSGRVARGYPRLLRSVFPPLDPQDHPESHLDAAYFSYSHNALFLFKDTSFWQVTNARDRRRHPHLPKNALLPQRQVHEHWFDICNVHPTTLKLNP